MHAKSLPTFRTIPEQLPPIGLLQAQAPQDRESLAPVFHVALVMPAWQERTPSNIAHFAGAISGTHAWAPKQPVPTIGAAQNRIVDAQVTAPGVGAPCGVHAPFGVATNALACTP